MKIASRSTAAFITLSALSVFALARSGEAVAGHGSEIRNPQRLRASVRPDNPRTLRLRSFRRGATGSLHFTPSETGGKVMLTTLNLPVPEEFAPAAHNYVVWAVGGSPGPVRLGELRIGESGNGGLVFQHPARMNSYSVIVTAETESSSRKPVGPIVLASRAREASVFFHSGAAASALTERRSLKDLRKRLRSQSNSKDFFGEVEAALDGSDNGGRFLELAGGEAAPQALGMPRAATNGRQAYVRAVIAGLQRQTPAAEGMTFVLWAVEPKGRAIYMGSVPTDRQDESELYVRLNNFDSDDYELTVTAEKQRSVASPSDFRALSTVRPSDEPISGPTGYSIPTKK